MVQVINNALTTSQQQSAEVIDARDGEVSLKARLDRDIEKAKQVYVNVEGCHISTDSSVGYLKDVEILGNTIQDASNLADIRSVGGKVEGQELYEIPVLSCGKNLFDGELELGGIFASTGKDDNSVSAQSWRRTSFISFEGANLTHSLDDVGNKYLFEYDNKFNFIRYTSTPDKTHTFNISSETKYVKITYNFIPTKDIQLEEGTVATPYEPYVEDKLTILSPVQLEKVGDVADRIVEKNGVWGVEKNVVDMLLNEANCTIRMRNSSEAHPNYALFDFSVTDTKSYVKTSELLCDKFNPLPYSADRDTCDKEGCWIGSAIFFTVKILKSKLESVNVDGMKKWLKTNNLNLKYLTTQPQFIPLPHDQQVKLRTFTNKTNISFLTEIEGTIKAQVPKSLGATVNTHTEQISNLNKELDRVKKLEESTVSTVETESDFTTVEATSNGYFEDVKLEGKTLVNLLANKMNVTLTSTNRVITSSFLKSLLVDKEYTLFISGVTAASYGAFISIKYTDETEQVINNKIIDNNLCIRFKISEAKEISKLNIAGWGNNPTESNWNINYAILLEGDHTQNPPSYFEGLKSVGDGVDEISVKSVKGDVPKPYTPHQSDKNVFYSTTTKLKRGKNLYFVNGIV